MLIKKSISIVFIICASTMYAQTCCSGGIPLSNNIGMSVEEKGTFQLSLNYDYNNLNTLNNGTEKLNDDSRLRITNSILFNISYAVTNRLSVEGLFTWVNQRRVISQFGNENLDQTSGIGDGLLLLKYNFKNGLGKNSNTELGLGAKIPFGSSTETNNQGITLNADLQPVVMLGMLFIFFQHQSKLILGLHLLFLEELFIEVPAPIILILKIQAINLGTKFKPFWVFQINFQS